MPTMPRRQQTSTSFSQLKLALAVVFNNSWSNNNNKRNTRLLGAVKSTTHTHSSDEKYAAFVYFSRAVFFAAQVWGLLCCLCSCSSCWSPDQIDAPKTGQIARKHGSRTDKLTSRGAAGALCWGGRADDPNKLKATKINYENFHFTFEFLVTCNFVKLMRLFGVPNLIMKMSLCKCRCLCHLRLCLWLFLFLSLCCAFWGTVTQSVSRSGMNFS